MIKKVIRTLIYERWLLSAIIIWIWCLWCCSQVKASEHHRLPLLSDLAYHHLRTLHQKTIAPVVIPTTVLPPTDFDQIMMSMNGTMAPIDSVQKKHALMIKHTLPYVNVTYNIVALKHNQPVWQSTQSHDMDDLNLSTLTLIHPFKRFQGYLVFADAYPRQAVDLSEPFGPENAVLIRGINHKLQTRFIAFAHTQDLLVPRHPLQIKTNKTDLFWSHDGHKGARIPLDPFLHKPQIFDGPQSLSAHKCFNHHASHEFSVSKTDHSLILSRLSQKCKKPSQFIDHLWHATQHQSLGSPLFHSSSLTIPLTSELNRRLHQKNMITHISGPHPTEPDHMIVFIKTSSPHAFTQKIIDDDLVIVIDQSGTIDGAFAITTHYVSPRHNVDFLPTPHHYIQALAELPP